MSQEPAYSASPIPYGGSPPLGNPEDDWRSPKHAVLGEHFGLTRFSVNFSY